MTKSPLFAVVIAMPMLALPAIAPAQVSNDETGSISRTNPPRILTENAVRERLTRAGYTAIGSIDHDSDGVWRTTAMKGDSMMSISVNPEGTIEDR